MTIRILAAASLIALAAACSPAPAPPAPAPATPAAAASPTPTAAALDTAAVLSPEGRPAADPADDAARKPGDVLVFSNIAAGQTVFEMEAGSGWYTELLSRAVGPGGKVIMQAPPEFQGFYKDQLDARLAGNRLANVQVSWSSFEKLEAADASVDVVTWFLGPHELYFKAPPFPNGLGDPAKVYAEAFRILKPGGYFVVMDHAAASGSPPQESGSKLHRIDPAQVRASLSSAGFTIEEESNLLANPQDPKTVSAVDPSMHFKTDQFLFRAMKPATVQ